MSIGMTSVHSEINLHLVLPGRPSLPVRAELRYDASDPYAVQIAFHTGSATDASQDVVEWTFARELLSDGVRGAAGEGDVQVWPSIDAGEPVMCLALSSPSGRALFEVPADVLVDFLSRTYDAVSTGSESRYVDLDAELALLLSAEPEA